MTGLNTKILYLVADNRKRPWYQTLNIASPIDLQSGTCNTGLSNAKTGGLHRPLPLANHRGCGAASTAVFNTQRRVISVSTSLMSAINRAVGLRRNLAI